jgi:hypothetical protein
MRETVQHEITCLHPSGFFIAPSPPANPEKRHPLSRWQERIRVRADGWGYPPTSILLCKGWRNSGDYFFDLIKDFCYQLGDKFSFSPLTLCLEFAISGLYFRCGKMGGNQLTRQWRIMRAIEASTIRLNVAEIATWKKTGIVIIYRDLEASRQFWFPEWFSRIKT